MSFEAFCWSLFVLSWVGLAFWSKPAVERQGWKRRFIMIVFLAVTFLLLAGKIPGRALNARILPAAISLRVAGDTLMVAGLLTAIWARIALGGNWSATISFKAGHELIERGPYRFVRHPMYTGLLLMILGTAIVVGNLSGLLSLTVGFLGMWRKLRQEEVLLARHFPDSYPQYMSRTRALLPFLL